MMTASSDPDAGGGEGWSVLRRQDLVKKDKGSCAELWKVSFRIC
jgi:hypothetical protein